ncbi:Hypothetical predicted protein [Cloeon dipterum]|uniref:Phosphatidylinositol-specific phospholipase C X domain-containing protein n=1 Tax=Cloeon dipterum TaxID=197152 RepID=A0A8S1CTE9_9INSE|nr:Hypothetical predicted protein [Cloeon dipterum]
MPLTLTEFLVLLAALTTALFHSSVSDELPWDDCHVFITVGSYWYKSIKNDGLKGLQTRHLELNWEPTLCGGNLYSVFLFSEDPTNESFNQTESFLDSVVCNQHPRNFYRTNATLGRPKLPGGWDKETILRNEQNNATTMPTPGNHCLPYWIAALSRNGSLLASDCLKIRPTWMGDMKSQIEGARVSKLMIPGTHNSGCYYGKDIGSRGDVIYRFTRTQDEDIWEQLVWGARYLDLRVGYYERKNEQFWINHARERITELRPVLQDVARFMRMSPNEVVIVDFHRFPVGFSGKFQKYAVRHRWLANLINEELGSMATQCVFMSSPRLSDLWHSGKRLMVYHAKRHEVHVNWNDDWLCAPLLQAWGNQQNATGLGNYIEEAMQRYSGRPLPWSIMAELTPKYSDAILRPQRGLRMMADDVNRGITNLFRHKWWKDANIVATDFLLGNKIIDVAIEANEKRYPKYASKSYLPNGY